MKLVLWLKQNKQLSLKTKKQDIQPFKKEKQDIHSHKMYVLLFYIPQTLCKEFFHLSKYNVHQFCSCLNARPCDMRRD